jgi:hypothetical protein
MTVHLSVVERRVNVDDESGYIASLAERRAAARAASAQFWVFAHGSDSHRYMEFVEGSDALQVARISGVEQDDLWHAVEVK